MTAKLERYPRIVGRLGVLLILALTLGPATQGLGDSMSPRKHKFFLRLYRELHPEDAAIERDFANPEKWAIRERERLEPIVLGILRDEYDDIPWNYALTMVAPLMPTQAIRDEVYARMDSMYREKIVTKAPLDARDHGLLSQMVTVLAAGNDQRAASALADLIPRDDYDYDVGRKYVAAARTVGDGRSAAALRKMPLRIRNEWVDREAALTEKIIEARIKGEKVSADADRELRQLSQRFLQAIEKRDQEKFVSCFPFGFREGFDGENDFQEFLDGVGAGIKGLSRALDGSARFDVDDENLTAVLELPEGYRVEFIYEVDGWKISNIRPTREPQRQKTDR